jgi:hypothetical protein
MGTTVESDQALRQKIAKKNKDGVNQESHHPEKPAEGKSSS